MSAASPALSLTRIGQIAIRVHDVDRAVAFYREVLGMPLLFRAGALAFFDCGGIRLLLSPPEQPEFDHSPSILYYRVDDLPQAAAALAARGIALERDPHLVARMSDHELWMVFLRDSEGNLLALMSEVRPGGGTGNASEVSGNA